MNARIHPVGIRMLKTAGVDPQAWAQNVFSSKIGIFNEGGGLSRLPIHSAGHSSKGRIGMTIELGGGVLFNSGPSPDAARLVISGTKVPETLRMALVGKPVTALASHPLLAIDGLIIKHIEDTIDTPTGQKSVYVAIAEVPWVMIPGKGVVDWISRGIDHILKRT